MPSLKKMLKGLGAIVCAIALLIAILAIYHHASLGFEAKELQPTGQMVDVGGYSVHVYSEGKNAAAPTLVFMSGAATVAPTYDFKALYSLLSDDYRIAVVEKAGYGYSDIVDIPRDVGSMVGEARAALDGAGIGGPYVLVPHSMSGLEAIYWAQHYPGEVSGIVGVDMAVPAAYDDESFDMGKTRLLMTVGKLSADLGLLRISGIYPLNEACLTDDEANQQKLLMHRNAVNADYIAEGNAVCDNARAVEEGGGISCPLLMFCSDGTETGEPWIRAQEEFAEANGAQLMHFDCGHYIHYFKSEEMAVGIKRFVKALPAS